MRFQIMDKNCINILPLLISSMIICSSSSFSPHIPIEPVTWSMEDVVLLKENLFNDYDTELRPTLTCEKINCYIGLTITHVEVNEAKISVILYGYLDIRWNDPTLTWNPLIYGGVNYIKVYPQQIWKPDIYLFNMYMELSSLSRRYTTLVTVYPNGDVHSRNPGNFTVACDLDSSRWPYDSQRCQLIFLPWTTSNNEIEVQILDNRTKIPLNLLNSNSQWKIENVTSEKYTEAYSYGNYSQLWFNITISRHSPTNYYVIVPPLLANMVFVLGSFCVSPRSTGKLILISLAAVFCALFLLFYSRKLPVVGPNNTPLIMLFYNKMLYIIGLTIFEAVLVMILVKVKNSQPLPDFVRKYLIKKPDIFIQFNKTEENISDENNPDGYEMIKNDSRPLKKIGDLSKRSLGDENEEYILLASLIDKFAFLLTIAVFIIFLLTHSLQHY